LHVVSGPAALLIGLIGSLDPTRGPVKTLLGGLAGFGIVFIFYLLGGLMGKLIARLRRQPLDEVAFGFGDVTLSGVIGLAVGWPGILIALVLGILAAGLYSSIYLLVMLLRHSYTAFQPIPYGPFLVLGAVLVYFGRHEMLMFVLGSLYSPTPPNCCDSVTIELCRGDTMWSLTHWY